ncbi:hypothetical protein AwErysi_00070 [Erysipelotrichaceae bacterium]|nr:hypothetical protein AwErysi_00070 [Erysipelotrichaceae bacterium]
MLKIVVGGQIDKPEIAELVRVCGGDAIEVSVQSDLDAAMSLQAGSVDYYIGACNTGGGGALAMAMALVGHDFCATLSMPGNIKSEAEIRGEIQAGKKAFGFTAQDKEQIIPIVISELLKK